MSVLQKLRGAKAKVGSFIQNNKGKLAVAGGALAIGAAAYGAYKLYKGAKGQKRNQSLSKIRNRRRIMQEKVKLMRAHRAFNREVERQ